MFDTKKMAVIVICSVFILSGGVVVSAFMLSKFAVKIQKSHVPVANITVKGVAEKEIVSDIGTFGCSISCKAKDIAAGYAEINRLNNLLQAKFRELGIKPEWIENESVNYRCVNKTISRKSNNIERVTEEFSHYLFTRYCRVRSEDVKKIEQASFRLYELTSYGVNISIDSVQFFISDLEQYKLDLIDSASASAFQRAEVVAEKCGANLGKLIKARQGVIQITCPASNETSNYGIYDTSTIKKVMRLVVTLDFELE